MTVLTLRHYIGGAVILSFLLLLAWGFRVDHLRAEWKGKHDTLLSQAGAVLAATRVAADNPDLGWASTAGQIVALGEDHRSLKFELDEQNRRIDEMAREAVRLRAKAAELQRIADRAQAQRRAALERLADLTITPGTRDDCIILLREAEDALDLVREAGL